MTLIDDRPWRAGELQLPVRQSTRRTEVPMGLEAPMRQLAGGARQLAGGARQVRPRRRDSARPMGARPAIAPLSYRRHQIAVSRAVHPRRAVSASVTAGLAGLAALITLWLGFVAQFSGSHGADPADVPDRLAVVRVQAGETLQHLAARVAPGAPAEAVVERIRSLNELDSAALDAGQTLIAPVG